MLLPVLTVSNHGYRKAWGMVALGADDWASFLVLSLRGRTAGTWAGSWQEPKSRDTFDTREASRSMNICAGGDHC